MADYGNICKHIHLPAQSGNSRVLESMRRGYTRESYTNLAQRIRKIIPHVSITSDFIVGFCGETEEDFQDTLTLVQEVEYNKSYTFAYSQREVRKILYDFFVFWIFLIVLMIIYLNKTLGNTT